MAKSAFLVWFSFQDSKRCLRRATPTLKLCQQASVNAAIFEPIKNKILLLTLCVRPDFTPIL